MKIARVVACIAIVVLLGGCVAAAPLLLLGSVGVTALSGYKIIQTSTGGKMGVGFKDAPLSPDAKASLVAIKRLAIWPDNDAEVRFAEVLQSSGQFEVITPAATLQAIKRKSLPEKFDSLTALEATIILDALCAEAKADGVVVLKAAGSQASVNFFSLDRAKQTTNFQMLVYSKTRRAIVITQSGELVVEQGSTVVGQLDMLRALGEGAAGRLIELTK